MKKLFLLLGMSIMTSFAIANEIKEKKIVEKKVEPSVHTCCTATLTYNGQYYDHRESCQSWATYEQNCALAASAIKAAHPQAFTMN